MKHSFILLLLAILPASADLAWIDIDHPNGPTADFYSSLEATSGASVSAGNLTFTLLGAGMDNRNRSSGGDLLKDFAFAQTLTLRIEGLPVGNFDVETWHYDGGTFDGAVDIDVREQGQSNGTRVVTGFAFSGTSTSPASFQISSDGATTYEIVIRENPSTFRLTRLNGLRIRAAGSPVAAPLQFIDADTTNTQAAGNSPDPFSSSTSDPGGPLWKLRSGFGFGANSNREIYEKDATIGGDNVGDAALLETTASGLVPGREYGVYVCYLSIPNESWRVRAGLAEDNLTEFTPSSPNDAVFDLGANNNLTNINEYLGFLGNATADASGNLRVYVDDAEGTGNSQRTWYEGIALGSPYEAPPVIPIPVGTVEVAPDGVWTWFNDERAIFHNGALYSGYVRTDGHVGLTRYDPETGLANHMQLSTGAAQEIDDHNNPSITVLPDNRLLVVYARHIADRFFFYRISTVTDPASDSDWSSEMRQSTPRRTTYSNTYRLSEESNKIYNFQRNINFNPTVSISTDNGLTWSSPAHFIRTGNGSTRPYHRYISNHRDRIDLIYTDAHPVNDPTSLYHIFYQDNNIHYTNRDLLKSFDNIPLEHDSGERGTVVYQYTAANWGPEDGPDDWIPTGRTWNWDIHYDKAGHPVCVFQVERNDVTGTGWRNNRIYYYYARWTGTEWQKRFIAHAGRGIYGAAPNYGGGMAIDPEDTRIVYISTNAANPFDISRANISNVPLNPNNERYELWKGFTSDGGLTFEWTPITENSAQDNLRPIVPENHGRTSQLLWFFGRYTTYLDYDTRVLGLFDPEKKGYLEWRSEYGLGLITGIDQDSDADGSSDLLEYALGGNPTDPGDLPVQKMTENQYSFRYSSALTDVEWAIETSTDLLTWDEVALVRAGGLPNEVANGYSLNLTEGDQDMMTLSLDPLSNESELFVRVRVISQVE